VPEAKVNEETLRLPLLEGLDRIEQKLGGTTLFEFMKVEALREDVQDAETRVQMYELLRQSLLAPSFAAVLTASVGSAGEASGAAGTAALFLHQAARVPELAAAVDELQARHPSLTRVLAKREEERASAEAARDASPPGRSLFSLWREVAGPGRDRERLAEIEIRQLSGLMSTTMPRGYDPAASIASLQLRDLFGFITVEAYVRYVLHLSIAQGRISDPGGAEAMNAEVAAWVRAKEPGP